MYAELIKIIDKEQCICKYIVVEDASKQALLDNCLQYVSYIPFEIEDEEYRTLFELEVNELLEFMEGIEQEAQPMYMN